MKVLKNAEYFIKLHQSYSAIELVDDVRSNTMDFRDFKCSKFRIIFRCYQQKCYLERFVFLNDFLTLYDLGGSSPWKVFKMLNFDVVMTPTMSRNIFGVIWKFWKNSIFWVILESLLQLKRILDHFKSWNYPFLCVLWVTKLFELLKVPEGGALLIVSSTHLSGPSNVIYLKMNC